MGKSMNRISTRAILICFTFCLTLASTFSRASEKANLIYENYFGDYFIGQTYSNIEISFEVDSPASLWELLKRLHPTVKADLLLIGYGKEDEVENYRVATTDIKNSVPLADIAALQSLQLQPGFRFFLRWVNPSYSHYVNSTAPLHHPTSPFKHLPAIGQKVIFF